MSLHSHAQIERSQVHWDEGLRFTTKNSAFQSKFGGRIMYDLVGVDQSRALTEAYGAMKGASGFRRLRAFNSGHYGRLKYKAQVEFSKEQWEIEDLYVEVGELPGVGNLRLGHFKEPFMLEALTSSKYITFMERALPNLFSESRNFGAMLHDNVSGTRIYWQLGTFYSRERTDAGLFGERKYSFIGRVSGLVARKPESGRFLHLGMAVKQTMLVDHGFKFGARPESYLMPKYISTGNIDNAKSLTYVSLESMWMLGSFTLQSEYVQTRVHITPEGNAVSRHTTHGAYAQAAFMLTGETRNFKDCNKGFGRVRPAHDMGKDGFGALELAVRYSYADLSHADLAGGVMHNFALGLNWYLNSQSRIVINYVQSTVDGMGTSDIYQTRFQVEF